MKPRFFVGLQSWNISFSVPFHTELGFPLSLLNPQKTDPEDRQAMPVREIERRKDRVFLSFVVGCLLIAGAVLLAIFWR